MIGRRVTRASDEAEFAVTGVMADGLYVLVPLGEFGPSITASAADLAADFGVDAQPPADADEEAGWSALDAAAHEAHMASRRGDLPVAPTPEQFLAEAAADAN